MGANRTLKKAGNSYLSGWPLSSKEQKRSAGEDAEGLEPLRTVDGNVNGAARMENNTVCDPAISLLGIYAKEFKESWRFKQTNKKVE